VRAGIRTFFRRPVALTGLFFMFMAALSLVAIVPVVGGIARWCWCPRSRWADGRHARPTPGAFRCPASCSWPFTRAAHARAMLWVGAFYALAVLCVVGVSALIDGGQFAQMYVGGGGGLSAERMEDPRFLAALWVSTLLLPVSLAFWYAPALVHWYGVTPAKSLFFSVVAVLRNARAFLVYGLLWTALSLGVGLLMMLVLLMTTSHSDIALATMMFPLSVVLAAMFFSSLVHLHGQLQADDDALIDTPRHEHTLDHRGRAPHRARLPALGRHAPVSRRPARAGRCRSTSRTNPPTPPAASSTGWHARCFCTRCATAGSAKAPRSSNRPRAARRCPRPTSRACWACPSSPSCRAAPRRPRWRRSPSTAGAATSSSGATRSTPRPSAWRASATATTWTSSPTPSAPPTGAATTTSRSPSSSR
jgi:hypothetical protein